MNRHITSSAAACMIHLALGAAPAGAQLPATFLGLGDLPGGSFASRATAVAFTYPIPTVLGESHSAEGWRAFRWTQEWGMVNVGALNPSDQFSTAFGASQNGTVVGASGAALSPYECLAFRTSGTLVPLGPFAGGGSAAIARAISHNGDVIVGQAGAIPGGPRAFRWTLATGAVGLGTLPGGSLDSSDATGIDADGATIVGYARDADLATQAFRWTASTGMVGLGFLNTSGFRDSRAWAINLPHSSVPEYTAIVGESTSPMGPQEAFLWRPLTGMVGLGDLPGGEFRSVALAAGFQGARVYGWSDTADGPRAFIWESGAGMSDLKTVLESQGYNVAGWTLLRVTGCHGETLTGDGINPSGQPEAWFAKPACYADCNGSGATTIADYGCFQARFVMQHPYGDCNGSGTFTIADFGCFRSAMVVGCP